MDIEEARKKIQITDEERFAVADYLEFSHTQKNLLGKFEVLDYIETNKKGWLIKGVESGNPQKNEEVGEEILSDIENFSNIYSAMVKYMHENSGPTRLMRGTSVKEANKLRAGRTYDKIISTTTDKTKAMSFGDSHEPAFLRIIAGADIPFIDVTDFIGEEDLNREEEEYILAPFSKVKSATFRSKYNGYSYYDVELEKPELRQFEEGEKDSFANNIKFGFTEIIELGKELQRIEDKYESISIKRRYTRDIEDLKAMHEDQFKIMEQISEISSKVRDFSDMLKKYIQGCCAEKEQEYLQAHEIVEKENKRIAEEKRQAEVEQARKKGIADFEKRTQKFSENSKKVPQDLYSQYQSLKSEEMKYYNIATTLGLEIDLLVDNNTIEPNLEKIGQNIIEMKKRIDEIKLTQESSVSEVQKAFETMEPYEEALLNSSRNRVELSEVVYDYGNEALLAIKKGVDEKAQEMLKHTKLQLLQIKRNEVENRRIGWFGKLRGLDKLKAVELEGIDLEMQLLKNTPIQPKSNYSMRETLSDMRVFSIRELGSQMTEEMQILENNVKSIFGVDESGVYELTVRKLNAHPMVIVDPRKKERIADKINKISDRNQNLRVEISKAQYNSYKYANPISTYNQDNPRKRFASVMQNTARITELPEGQGDEIRTKEEVQIDDDWLAK